MEDPCGKSGDTSYETKDNISLQWTSPFWKWKGLAFIGGQNSIKNVSSKYTKKLLANLYQCCAFIWFLK